MSADPAVIARLAEELEASKQAALVDASRLEAAHQAWIRADDDSRIGRRRLDEDRYTLLYYAEHAEMPKPGMRYLDFTFPEA